MKALDKLYVEITNGRWIGRTSDVPQSEDSVEYIRKDYLLEKIRKTAIWNTIRVGKQEIRDIVKKIIESI